MPKEKVGMRVGVIISTNEKTVNMAGYGVYEGDLPSPFGFPNPCIRLDNGQKVWGLESWWGPEEEVKKLIGSRQVVIVKLDPNRFDKN